MTGGRRSQFLVWIFLILAKFMKISKIVLDPEERVYREHLRVDSMQFKEQEIRSIEEILLLGRTKLHHRLRQELPHPDPLGMKVFTQQTILIWTLSMPLSSDQALHMMIRF